MITEAKIGTTLAGMVFVESLLSGTMRPPDMDYRPGRSVEFLANGQVRWVGLPWAEWIFTEITPPMVDALAAYCPEGSASVFIRTRTNRNNDEYKDFSAVMVWDENETFKHFLRRRPELTIRFYDLVLAGP